MAALQHELSPIHKELQELHISLDFFNKKYEEMKDEIIKLKSENECYKKLTTRLETNIKELSERLNNTELHLREKNLEFRGIPEHHNENLLRLMEQCSSLVGSKVKKDEIVLQSINGDDAISYVQVKREGNLCIVKGKICPEHKVHAKLYGVTLVIDEQEEAVKLIECHDCVASQGGCKHAIAFLMWVHRRSEDPSCTSIECYWIKSKLSRVGTTVKYITAKDLSKGKPSLSSNTGVFEKFLAEGKKRKLTNCEIIKYQKDYVFAGPEGFSMDKLVQKYKETSCDTFLSRVVLTDSDISNIEKETRDQHKSSLWHELRYGRITASRAYEFSRCKTSDGTLIAVILGGKIPDTTAMKRGRILEDDVRNTVSAKLGKRIKKCGLMIAKNYPMLAGSPDGICENSIIEIKCPMSEKTFKNYICDGKPSQKFYVQMQLQMLLTGLKKGYFCVADCNYSTNKKVQILDIQYDEKYVSDFINVIVPLWKDNIYPILHQSIL
ncbi:unnamed protein product [Diatraea saccharalis]|uniref:YqaJ viral recombinase domain-containing protein n=1 Tax=Diatraea saccharalis TaxID=40085 RepID=A0A9N9WF58_9NEOP|nr:unnamed protein product [Diatraea saccharalis]